MRHVWSKELTPHVVPQEGAIGIGQLWHEVGQGAGAGLQCAPQHIARGLGDGELLVAHNHYVPVLQREVGVLKGLGGQAEHHAVR